MNILQNTPLFLAAGALAACSSAAPYVAGTAQNSGGTYSITQSGATTVLPAPGAALVDGMFVWDGSTGTQKGFVFESADVVAIAVMDTATQETIAGISGTAAASVPTTGTAIYSGGFSANYYRQQTGNPSYVRNLSGPLTTNVNFGAGTLSGQGTAIGTFDNPTLSVSGTISGTEFTGTATIGSANEFTGSGSAPLAGGFYGTSTLAGVYQGSNFTGVIWGETP